MTVIDEIRSRARERPDHPALIAKRSEGEADRVVSYRELVQRMDAFAERLRKAGCNPGDRIGLLASQGVGFIEAGLGILAADLCFVPISDDYDGAALEAFVRRTRLHALLRESLSFEVKRYADVGDVDGQQDRAFHALHPAYVRFTSGTTNERKGVLIGHQAILDRLRNANHGLGIGPEDRIMWMLPMVHHFVVSILLYLRYGATILLPSSYLPGPVLEFANSHGATVFYASPYHYALLAKDEGDLGLPKVRIAISTASGLSGNTAEQFLQRMGIPLSQALGIIEVGLPVINLERPREKPFCLGQVLPGYEVWLRGEDGEPVTGVEAQETGGEVCIRGTGTFDAYIDPWIPAADIMEPDGFRTGDSGYFDADGDLCLRGRRHNRINMAGMKFFAEEVETVIDAHPQVEESRVYGRVHDHLGEIPMAEVVPVDPANPPTSKDLSDLCRRQLATHKVPFRFAIVSELARTSTGKIRRH
jgi:long-chain acyl-CoA synthetase